MQTSFRKENAYAVIMAGGIGSRFWPLSRAKHPKQFLDILDTGMSPIQATWKRLAGLVDTRNILIVTNQEYRDLVLEQLPEATERSLLLEPAGRNTAPCIAYATFRIMAENPDAVVLVSPADHLILGDEEFKKDALTCLEAAVHGHPLITIGIKPTRPDTGYGYIQYSQEKGLPEGLHRVKTFTEKPDQDLAKTFLESGDFLWNAGMFIWHVQAISQAFAQHLPDMYELFHEGRQKMGTPGEKNFIKKVYERCTNISIDYGIMERADKVWVRPAGFNWTDLGTWGSVYGLKEKDYVGNAVVGKKVMMYDSNHCMVHVPQDKVVILEGLENYIVVDTPDALMVCRLEKEQQIKQFVTDVRKLENGKFV